MRPTRVLVIDNESDIRILVGVIVRRTCPGVEVHEAPDVRSALGRVGSLRPDLILLDHAMPGVTGLDAIPALRAGAPNATIVLLTAMRVSQEQAFDAGADALLAKPFDASELTAIVADVAARVVTG